MRSAGTRVHQKIKKKIAIVFTLSMCILGVFFIARQFYSAVTFENDIEQFVVRHIIDWRRKTSPEVELRNDYMIISRNEHRRLTVGEIVLLEWRSARAGKWDWQEKTLSEVAEGDLNSLTHCHRT